jgi:hypothetical protein
MKENNSKLIFSKKERITHCSHCRTCIQSRSHSFLHSKTFSVGKEGKRDEIKGFLLLRRMHSSSVLRMIYQVLPIAAIYSVVQAKRQLISTIHVVISEATSVWLFLTCA